MARRRLRVIRRRLRPQKHKIPPSPIDRVLTPFRLFAKRESSSGIALIIATAIAFILANSPWHSLYEHVWEAHFAFGLDKWIISKPLHIWINDGLMAMFFFVIGLEIKREILAGELSSPRKALLPLVAALGGMALPALFYLFFNQGGGGARGWGVPTATDIAFALGILALLGDKVPASLKVFLTALAVADDLGAVLIIAIFYSSDISLVSLGVAEVFFVLLLLCNWSGVRAPSVYALLSIGGLWLAFLFSGIHPTIAGVLTAFTIPARAKVNLNQFLRKTKNLLRVFRKTKKSDQQIIIAKERLLALLELRLNCEDACTPLQCIEKQMHPWVAFLILPLFALANAGVRIEGSIQSIFFNPIALGILLGLVVGKQLGITFFSWLAVRSGWATLPTGATWRDIYFVSWLGGIGFTMSIFISMLAFENPSRVQSAKAAILLASIIAASGGWILLRFFRKKPVLVDSRLVDTSKDQPEPRLAAN